MSALKIYSPAIVLVLVALARIAFGLGLLVMVVSPLVIAASVIVHIREEHRQRRIRDAHRG